jgi:hypothetical protein
MKLSNGCWRNGAGFSVLLLGIVLGGCSQRESLPTAEANSLPDQHLPFEGTSDKTGFSPTGAPMPVIIPAGTPLTIHLRLALSSASSRPGDPFDAELDEPILIQGRTLVSKGTALSGRVLDARASDRFQEPGYLRLALTAISVEGKSISIQTSSIFMKRGSHEQRNMTIVSDGSGRKNTLIGASVDTPGATYATGSMDVGVAPERQLTFRLAQQLPL